VALNIYFYGESLSAGRMTRVRSAKFKLLEKLAIEAAPAAQQLDIKRSSAWAFWRLGFGP